MLDSKSQMYFSTLPMLCFLWDVIKSGDGTIIAIATQLKPVKQWFNKQERNVYPFTDLKKKIHSFYPQNWYIFTQTFNKK